MGRSTTETKVGFKHTVGKHVVSEVGSWLKQKRKKLWGQTTRSDLLRFWWEFREHGKEPGASVLGAMVMG